MLESSGRGQPVAGLLPVVGLGPGLGQSGTMAGWHTPSALPVHRERIRLDGLWVWSPADVHRELLGQPRCKQIDSQGTELSLNCPEDFRT